MIVGILSDSHGRHERTRRAVSLLTENGAEAFIHCGDVGGEAVFEELVGLRVWFVWGNTDVPSPALRRYVELIGLECPQTIPLRLELDGKVIAVFHGHEAELQRFDPAGVDYILHGHTHERCDERIGATRIINPGALHRAREHTVATLDLHADALSFLTVA